MSDAGLRMPSARLKKSLAKAQMTYSKEIHLADGFLKDRGISLLEAMEWGLGVAVSPAPSHERFNGMLCIPYYNLAGVIALKFRCMQHHDCKGEGHPKYDGPAGQPQYLYNLPDLDRPERVIHVTEGELDAIVLRQVLAEPVVGVPGVDAWQTHWPSHFHSFDRVVAWPDGDKAGKTMAGVWTRKIGVEVVQVPTGQDVTSLYVESGPKAVKELYEGDGDVSRDD